MTDENTKAKLEDYARLEANYKSVCAQSKHTHERQHAEIVSMKAKLEAAEKIIKELEAKCLNAGQQ